MGAPDPKGGAPSSGPLDYERRVSMRNRAAGRRVAVGVVAGLLFGGMLSMCGGLMAAGAAGGGHGTYGLAKTFFPYSMAATGLTGTITKPLIVVALAQCPLYGVVIGVGAALGRGRHAVVAVAIAHAVAVLVAFVLASPSFTP